MYQKHFGLKTKPFGSNAEGPAVFVGPQQTQVINSLKKGLNAVDSVVAVSGPVGVGKTTIVSRALETLSPGRMVAKVGRMSLAPDEVLELLLTGFGISRQATGTIQRFAAFRRLLTERAAAGAQVAVVVEDAQRVGLDALVELESLTAADSGDATGANIILMGQLELNEWLATPALARLRQRTRLRQVIEPLTAPEILGYLRHCIRTAGGDFESMFDGGAVDMLYRCSEGIPRVINNLCESALTMAAEEDAGPLTAKFIQKIARDALGIEVFLPATPAPPLTPVVAAETVKPEAKPEPAPATAPEKIPEPAVSADPDIESTLTQKKPEWTIDQAGGVDDSNEEIPQELTFEVEQTARMQAINADKIIQAEKEGKKTGETREPTFKAAPMITVDKNTQVGVLPILTPQAETKSPPAQEPDDDELPMLSQSMRIEAPTPAPPEALLAEERPKPKPLPGTKPASNPKQKPQAVDKPVSQPKAEAKPAPKPKAPGAADAESKPKLKPPAPKKAEPKLKVPVPEKAQPQARPKPTEKSKAKAKPDSKAGEKPRMPDIGALEAAIEAAHQEATDDEPAAAPAAQTSAAVAKPASKKPVPAAKPAAKKPAAAAKPAAERPAPAAKPAAKRPVPAAKPAVKKTAPAAKPAAKKPTPAPEPAGDKGPDGTAVTLTGIPALTLDGVLEEKRSKSAKVIESEEGLGKAASLDDLTNTMAETLFGDAAFAAIAAEVVANPPPGKTATGKSSEDASPVMLESEQQASPVMLEAEEPTPTLTLEIEDEPESAGTSKPESPATGPKEMGQTGKFDMTMSKRIDMLKTLNSSPKSDKKSKREKTAKTDKGAAMEKIDLVEAKPAKVAPKANGSQPESLEQQMETAMTATVKAISDVDIPPGLDDDESKDSKSGGLLSRFKRS